MRKRDSGAGLSADEEDAAKLNGEPGDQDMSEQRSQDASGQELKVNISYGYSDNFIETRVLLLLKL